MGCGRTKGSVRRLACCALFILGTGSAQATLLTVTSLGDAGVGTLRGAMAAAGAGDTINFSVSGTITLTSAALPTVALGLTIDGTGQAVSISGNSAFRVFRVSAAGALTLNALSIVNGSDPTGGGILNDGTLTITNCTFSGNSAAATADGFGGAIDLNAGTVSINGSTFSGNSASGSAGAGSGHGGGIYQNAGTLLITNSVFSGNSATGIGGGAGFGGGVDFVAGTLTITDSTFSGNSATGNGSGAGFGGGVEQNGGTLAVTGSTFAGNRAVGGNTSGAAFGGGIDQGSGTLTVKNSTFNGNSATGSGSGSAFGGGIEENAGPTTITSSTFYGNSAVGGPSGNSFGGGVLQNPGNGGVFTLSNSIVANSTGANCGGNIVNGGNNIDSGTTCGWGAANGSLSNTAPLLGPLANNGGPTATMALIAGSPAIDGVTFSAPNGAPATDQRGVARPQGVRYDIGAYEGSVIATLPSTPVPTLNAGMLAALALLLLLASGAAAAARRKR